MIKCKNICKSFDKKTVLDGIDIDISEGQIFGLLGCFHMADRDLAVECSYRRSHRSSCISMNKDDIRLRFIQHIAQPKEYTGSHVVQVLTLLHDVQVIIRIHSENLQHLIQHLPMLPRYADYCLECFRMLLELLDQRAHLNGLRAGSENKHYLLHRLRHARLDRASL